ncbi:MAG: MG2 domain-containing protein, partial [Chloroflexi bacterium]|nr:MG2 domain-containing protein [Chloroflexota bacterium]
KLAGFGPGDPFQVLNSSGRRAVQYSFTYGTPPAPVAFNLVRLDLASWLSGDPQAEPGWSQRWVEEPGPRGNNYVHIEETILPADLPPGVYRLELSVNNWLQEQLTLFLSSYVLAIQDDGQQLVVWVTTMEGEPVANAEVAFYNAQGQLLLTGRSDNDGLYQVSRETAGPEPAWVVAYAGQEVAISGLGGAWQSDGYSPGGAYASIVTTDRPVYHAGQTVFFQAIIRQDNDAALSVLPAGAPVIASLVDQNGRIVLTTTLASNDFGAVNGSFLLDPAATSGRYRVEVAWGNYRNSQTFQVESRPVATHRVQVNTDAHAYVLGDTIQVVVESHDATGQPLANASVIVELYGSGGGRWGDPRRDSFWSVTYNDPIAGRTDANGRFTFSLEAEEGYFASPEHACSNTRYESWAIAAAVTTSDGQTATNFTVVEVASTAEEARLEVSSAIQEPGRPFAVNAQVKDLLGNPVANRALRLTLYDYNPTTNDYDRSIQETDLVTGADGRVTSPFTIYQPGRFQLVVSGTDSRSKEFNAFTFVYAYSADYTGPYGQPQGVLYVTADRESYLPGDVARLAIHSDFSGRAWLTFERGALYRWQLVQLTAPLTIVETPLTAAHAPNVFVTVHAWQPQTTTFDTSDYFSYRSLADAVLHTATAELTVTDPGKILNVTITPDSSGYTPGAAASFTVRVTNSRGEPVSAEVSLALVDGALLTRYNARTIPLTEAFFIPRNDAVAAFHSMVPSRDLTWDGGFGGCGCGGWWEEGDLAGDFGDVTLWFPGLRTNANGEATITLTLSDYPTTWRLSAWAVTADTQVGEASVTVTAGVAG